MTKTRPYWKPEPRRYSFAWFALLVPAILYAVGVIAYAHNAFVPNAHAENGHAIGSALMVLGGEAGTLAAAAEVFRKHQQSEANALDWLGLAVSLVATLGNLFVVYVALSTLDTQWTAFVREFGPLILLLCSGVDFYAGIMEFGFYNASFDARWEAWNTARHNDEMRQLRERAEVAQPAAEVARLAAEVPEVVSEVAPELSQVAEVASEAPQPAAEAPQVAPEAPELDELAMEVLQVYREDPEATQTAMAEAVGVSRPTVKKRLQQLEAAGKI